MPALIRHMNRPRAIPTPSMVRISPLTGRGCRRADRRGVRGSLREARTVPGRAIDGPSRGRRPFPPAERNLSSSRINLTSSPSSLPSIPPILPSIPPILPSRRTNRRKKNRAKVPPDAISVAPTPSTATISLLTPRRSPPATSPRRPRISPRSSESSRASDWWSFPRASILRSSRSVTRQINRPSATPTPSIVRISSPHALNIIEP